VANLFTAAEKYAILQDKVDVRCPNCAKLLLRAFALESKNELPAAWALALEIVCPRCKTKTVAPTLTLPAEK